MLSPVRTNERKPTTCLSRWDWTETIRPTFQWPLRWQRGKGERWWEESLLQPDVLFSWKRGPYRASRDPHEGGAGPRVAPCGGLWGATPRKCVVYKASGSASPFPRILLAKKKSRCVWNLAVPLYFYILGLINSFQPVNSKPWTPLQLRCHEQITKSTLSPPLRNE